MISLTGDRTLKHLAKVSLLLSGGVLFAVLGLLAFLLVSWGASKNKTRQSALSPDGRFVAELHTVITPMHGGPDTLYVAIRGKNDAFGETVFSRVYECDDTDGFNLRWTDAEELNVSSEECDAGHREDDRINTKRVMSRDVAIDYSTRTIQRRAKCPLHCSESRKPRALAR